MRRRVAVFVFVALVTCIGSLLMADLTGGMPMRGWNGAVVAVFTVLFALLAFGAAQATFGFLARRKFRRGARAGSSPDFESACTLLRRQGRTARTAIILPIYNEEAARVFAGLGAIYRSVERTGCLATFDFFVLSDSTAPDTWIDEETGWAALCRELGAHEKIFYRRRRNNLNRKAGNIADFCRRWGANYRYMVVLDADSIMSGETIVRLTARMEENPHVGLVQTAPTLVRAETLFARILQFGMRLYGPVFLAGLDFWQRGDGNYWGHNAIIRLEPFMKHCALPNLPGHEPFGGKILSHDFVEAALLRRSGWEVWMAPDLAGSYEEGPPTLIDAAKRDRRWCQGNLQHFWLLFARGLRGISRVHLLLGIFAYTASLIWLTFLVIGTLLGIGFHRTGLTWIPVPGYATSLGITPAAQSAILLGLTAVLLFGPKLLAVIDLLLQRGAAARFGGASRVIAGVVLESLFSALLAPVLMLFHSMFVLATLFGEGAGWGTQRRDSAEGTSWREALRAHGTQTLIGVVWLVVLVYAAPRLLAWMLPVLAGMLLAIPISVFTSRPSPGRAARRHGLLCTPEEIEPPQEIRDVDDALRASPSKETATRGSSADRGLLRVVVDPYVNAVHRRHLRVRRRQSMEIRRFFEAKREALLREGPGVLSPREKTALLCDAESVEWLHREIWRRPDDELAPFWRDALRQPHAMLDTA